jgi:hypothetical protein
MEQSELDDVPSGEKVSQEVVSVSSRGSELAAHVLAIRWKEAGGIERVLSIGSVKCVFTDTGTDTFSSQKSVARNGRRKIGCHPGPDERSRGS